MPSSGHNLIFAFAIAMATHGMLAIALAICFASFPVTDELERLDLTSIDLSFAKTIGETDAAALDAPSEPADAELPSHPPVDIDPPNPNADAIPTPRQQSLVLPSPVESIGMLTLSVPSTVPSATAMSRQAHIDAPPKPLCNIRPRYPLKSRIRGEFGDVSLEFDVTADGAVSSIYILKSPGFPSLEAAAVSAVSAARFTPAKSNGKPVASTARLSFTFKLN